MVDVVEIDFTRLQTVADGMGGKGRIVLLAGESFLLSRRNDVPILDEGSRTVMVEGGDAEQSHGTSSRPRLKTPYR
jgi:hypothetical protein